MTERFLRFRKSWDGPGDGRYVDVDVMRERYDDETGDPIGERKLASLMIAVDDLRSILERLDEEEQLERARDP